MNDKLKFKLTPAPLEYGAAETKAGFGLLEVTGGGHCLSLGTAEFDGKEYPGPHVSGYCLAEWLAWNWWRLLHEPRLHTRERKPQFEWRMAHTLYGAGEGYVWPRITIVSDGVRATVSSERSVGTRTAFRYFGAPSVHIKRTELATAIDDFVMQVCELLAEHGLHDTDLHRLWQEVRQEREDPQAARFRRLEAMLGLAPDDVAEATIERHLADASSLGENALNELASDAGGRGETMLSADDIAKLAKRHGFSANPRDAVRLNGTGADVPAWGEVAAWQVGAAAAKAVRRQERLDGAALSDARLVELAGSEKKTIGGRKKSPDFSFALDGEKATRVALHSPRKEGRRFNLARLLGDRILANGGNGNFTGERLLPATRTYLYRQQAQRAFAAELLSPFEAVRDMLGSDYSEENQHEAAVRYGVSDWMIRSSLRNHGYLSTEEAADLPTVF